MEGAPKQYTKEKIAELEKSRTLSDAELLKDGAEYIIDNNNEKRLQMTDKQLSMEEYENTRRDYLLKKKSFEDKYGAYMSGSETFEEFESKMKVISSLKEGDLFNYMTFERRSTLRDSKFGYDDKNPTFFTARFIRADLPSHIVLQNCGHDGSAIWELDVTFICSIKKYI